MPARGEHRVESEGDKEGDEDGKGDGHAELEEETADDAAHVGNRNEDGDDRHRGGKDRQTDLAGAEARRFEVILPHLQVADDILADDNGIVNEKADRQREGHEGHDVEGHAQSVHDNERGDDRNRQGDAGDDGGAPGVDEAEDDDDGEDAADEESLLDVGKGFAGHDRAVPHQAQDDAGGEFRLDFLHHLLAVDQGDLIGAGLFVDIEADGRGAIDEGEATFLFDPVGHRGDLAQGDAAPAPLDHHQLLIARGTGRFAVDAQRIFRPLPRQTPEGGVGIFALQPRHHFIDAEAEAVETGRIEFDRHLALGATDHVDLADAGDTLEALLDLLLDQGRQLARRQGIGLHRQSRHRQGIEVKFLNDRLFDRLREFTADRGDLGARLLGDLAELLLQPEFNDNGGDTLPRKREDVLDPGDLVDRLLDPFRDFAFHRLRGGAGESGDDGDDGDFDVGEHFHRELPIGEDAEGDEGKHHHRGKDRAFDGEIGEDHGG